MRKMKTAEHPLTARILLAAAACMLDPTGVLANGPAAGATSTTTTPAHKASTPVHHRIPLIDPTRDDVASYDDPIIRETAVEALGHEDGGVVVMDPNSGRILSAVNQPLVLSSSYIPCSTIKPVIAVAALREGILTRDSMLRVSRRRYMNLTEALAHSNNTFFESLGSQMGFETVTKYAREFGLGENVGRDIPEERAGEVPDEPPLRGGVARMSSFGEGFRITPLQLASVASTLANGGTLYYLQYPRTEQERRDFAPLVHRKLDVEPLLPDVREGMLAAVLYGTAKRAFDPGGEEILGKTGTCSEDGRRLGWYASYSNPEHPRMVVVVLLRGYRHHINGPSASAVAGKIYHRLRELNYPGLAASEPRNPAVTVGGDR
ncbi:MAG TPA: penicillin-binding transpeptidase domain-containing protein [Candidatus Acidoferrales bacterium]|nr:penicillin-binding transpeptidase domain-containing protein [Candidatus Acidoferrales bacterium]